MKYSGAFQWKEGKSSVDYSEDQVKSIVPTKMHKHNLPLTGIKRQEESN